MALVIFLIVAVAAYRLRAETRSRATVLIVGIALTVLVLAVFAVQTLQTAPQTFTAALGILALAFVLDLVWARVRRNHYPGAG